MQRRVVLVSVIGLAIGLLFSGAAGAAPLDVQVGRYHGGTNGVLSVEVRNPAGAPAQFSAQGLYFVPAGNPNQAPQRLGAVGPFQVLGQKGWQRRNGIEVPAGGSVKLKLDVYCIDSHRRSPTSGDQFRVAKGRMPAALSQKISNGSQRAADASGGFEAEAAKSAVQSEVWKERDKKWLKLDGEGAQEANK